MPDNKLQMSMMTNERAETLAQLQAWILEAITAEANAHPEILDGQVAPHLIEQLDGIKALVKLASSPMSLMVLGREQRREFLRMSIRLALITYWLEGAFR